MTTAGAWQAAEVSATVRRTLERALEGRGLGVVEGCSLMGASGADLAAAMAVACVLRERGKGATATYSRKLFIPLTNLCRDRCGYCTFARGPRQAGAHTMAPEEVLAVARQGARLGCKEALFSLGDHPELRHPEAARTLQALGYRTTPEYVAAMCRLVLEETGVLPHTNCGLLDGDELGLLRQVNISMGLMLESASQRLLQPGGAHFGCDTKAPALRAAMLARAGEMGIPMTTGILVGIGETPEERVDSLLLLRDLGSRYGHIQEVIVQNFRAKPSTRMRGAREPSMVEMLRVLSVARLLLGPEANIQAPPNLGGQGYQAYLLAGVNDWGGVSPLTRDFINPEAPWPHVSALRYATGEAGLVLRERLALYPEYVREAGRWLPPALAARARDLADDRGLVKECLETWR